MEKGAWGGLFKTPLMGEARVEDQGEGNLQESFEGLKGNTGWKKKKPVRQGGEKYYRLQGSPRRALPEGKKKFTILGGK